MRIAVLQPAYPETADLAATRRTTANIKQQLAALAPGRHDLVLLPEYSNCPAASSSDAIRAALEQDAGDMQRTMAHHARRCRTAIAAGLVVEHVGRMRNRTVLFGRDGEPLGAYDKIHLTQTERAEMGLHPGDRVAVIEWENVRVGFMTCFDVYFPELAIELRHRQVDLVLSPSYQRGESPWRIAALSQVRAIDIGAVLARASYAMRAETGGHSLICDASGAIIANAEQACGSFGADVEVGCGWVKPASFGGETMEHRRLIEDASRRNQ